MPCPWGSWGPAPTRPLRSIAREQERSWRFSCFHSYSLGFTRHFPRITPQEAGGAAERPRQKSLRSRGPGMTCSPWTRRGPHSRSCPRGRRGAWHLLLGPGAQQRQLQAQHQELRELRAWNHGADPAAAALRVLTFYLSFKHILGVYLNKPEEFHKSLTIKRKVNYCVTTATKTFKMFVMGNREVYIFIYSSTDTMYMSVYICIILYICVYMYL